VSLRVCDSGGAVATMERAVLVATSTGPRFLAGCRFPCTPRGDNYAEEQRDQRRLFEWRSDGKSCDMARGEKGRRRERENGVV